MKDKIIKIVLKTLDDKKAQNIKTFNVKKLTSLYDFIIVASSTNSTHIKSLTDEIIKILKENDISMFNIEKDEGYTWVIIDCDYFVVNLFHNKTREFYDLEGMWADANPF